MLVPSFEKLYGSNPLFEHCLKASLVKSHLQAAQSPDRKPICLTRSKSSLPLVCSPSLPLAHPQMKNSLSITQALCQTNKTRGARLNQFIEHMVQQRSRCADLFSCRMQVKRATC